MPPYSPVERRSSGMPSDVYRARTRVVEPRRPPMCRCRDNTVDDATVRDTTLTAGAGSCRSAEQPSYGGEDVAVERPVEATEDGEGLPGAAEERAQRPGQLRADEAEQRDPDVEQGHARRPGCRAA